MNDTCARTLTDFVADVIEAAKAIDDYTGVGEAEAFRRAADLFVHVARFLHHGRPPQAD